MSSVDASKLRRKFASLEKSVHEALTKQIEKEAERLVREMNALKPAVAGLTVGWTWGDAPRGSVQIGKYGKAEAEEIKVTIYATHRSASAWWFEEGTAPRFQKKTGRYTGQITAQPFFFPAYRSNKQQMMNRLRAALRRAVRRLNA